MDLAQVIDRINKLRALSTSSNANEAAAAASAANKLMDQYRLSTADLEVEGQASEPLEEDEGYIYQTGRVTRWKDDLMDVLVSHFGLFVWNDTTYPQGRQISRFRLVGRKSDITMAKYMFAWLSTECQRLSDLHAKGKGRVYAASYCRGFVKGIADQLNASRQEVQKDATSQALVKINQRSDEAEKFLMSFRPNLRTISIKTHNRFNEHAFSSGRVNGQAVHLGSSLGVGGTKLLNK